MAFDDEDKNENVSEPSDTVEDAAIDAVQEVLKDPDEDDGPRAGFFDRWMGFLSIMFLLGIVVAVLAAAGTYGWGVPRRNGPGIRGVPVMSNEEWKVLERRIGKNAVIGFVVGAAMGGTYVLKCLIRGVDP